MVLKLVSEDVTHGSFLDGYQTTASVPPGEVRVVGFTANKTGSFTFRCSKTCGDFHPYMVGRLKVLPNRVYQIGLALVPARSRVADPGWPADQTGGPQAVRDGAPGLAL